MRGREEVRGCRHRCAIAIPGPLILTLHQKESSASHLKTDLVCVCTSVCAYICVGKHTCTLLNMKVTGQPCVSFPKSHLSYFFHASLSLKPNESPASPRVLPVSTSCDYKIKSPCPIFFMWCWGSNSCPDYQMSHLPNPPDNPLVHAKTVFPSFLPEPRTISL